MKVLREMDAENFLEKEGFNVINRKFVDKKSELKNLVFPIAMKLSAKGVIHKARIGGVITNIKCLNEAEKAFDKLKKKKGFEGVLIQEMFKGEELILGLKHTEEFGMAILIGAGGRKVEEKKDLSFRIIPITEKEAENMIKEINFYKRLKKKKINFNLLIKNIVKLSNLGRKYPSIMEFDINPLMINSREAVIVDARVIFNK